MGPKIIFAKNRDDALSHNPVKLFEEQGILVIENPQIDMNLDLLQSYLSNKRRKFDDPFVDGSFDSIFTKELKKTHKNMIALVKYVYPQYTEWKRISSPSFRNMVSGPELLHFDSWEPEGIGKITSFINVDSGPRVYKLSYLFNELLDEREDLEKKAIRAYKNNQNISVTLRSFMQKNLPLKTVEFPSGSCWFFWAKTISHSLHFGRGAIGNGWDVPQSKVPMQENFILDRI